MLFPAERARQVIYVTSEPVEGREEEVVLRNAERCSTENAMMKLLSEHDGGKINGWSVNAVQYRLFLLLHLRNVMTLVNWKRPREVAQVRRLLAKRKRRSYLGGLGAAIYAHKVIFSTYAPQEAIDTGEERGVGKTV